MSVTMFYAPTVAQCWPLAQGVVDTGTDHLDEGHTGDLVATPWAAGVGG